MSPGDYRFNTLRFIHNEEMHTSFLAPKILIVLFSMSANHFTNGQSYRKRDVS